MTKIDWLHHEKTTTAEAIYALQAQDSPKPKAESVQNVQNEDLISRKAAIDVLATMQGLCTSKVALVQNSKIWQQIKDLPSAQPEPQWIPVSERLPAYGEDVILAIGKFCNVGYLVAVNDETDGEWYYSGWYHPMNDVIAWMPLPEPYRRGGEDE